MPVATRRVVPPRAVTVTAAVQAAVLTGDGKVEVRETELRDPGRGEVRIRLEGCGVCASSLPVWEGRPWFDYPREPGEPGHEGWGRIDAVGEGVPDFKPGERVTFLSQRSFATHEVVPAGALVRLPAGLAGRSVPGEALGCAMNIFRRSRIRKGQTVAVVGAGFLGSLLTSLASGAGARVIAISRRDHSLEVARRFGAMEALRMGEQWAVVQQVEQLTNGQLCDRVIEATGKQEGLDLAAAVTRERGRLIIAGYHQDGLRQVNMQLWNWRGMDVINAHERDPRVYIRGIEEAVLALTARWLNPWPLFTHCFTLSEAGEALRMTQERPPGFVKALILFEHGKENCDEPSSTPPGLDDRRYLGRSLDPRA